MATRLFASLACVLAMAAPCVAGAAMFKCVGKDGAISYQADPCPETGNEKKLKEPPPGPSGGKSGSPWKEGWTADDIKSMADGCVPNVVGPAKKDFQARAQKANDTSAEFPEAELTAGVRTMCNCLARRVGTTYARADFQSNRQAILKKLNDEAVAGGACKPEGLLGEVMGR